MPVPATQKEMEQLLDSLPSVTTVERRLQVEGQQLSAESVLSCHQRRSIVLLNTVGRAQAMYGQLQAKVQRNAINQPVTLLHSRFFKDDRVKKEREIRSRFGRNSGEPGILVATQVIEAGLDISCEHLHTELCPMNALIQRAGRCARFEGEAGTVHLYPLPAEERGWLPYGDLHKADATVERTRRLLERIGSTILHPKNVAQWVQEVHGPEDQAALQEGWRSRLPCLRRIQQSAFLRDPKRISDLLRGDETESIRVIVSEKRNLPHAPAFREAVTVQAAPVF